MAPRPLRFLILLAVVSPPLARSAPMTCEEGKAKLHDASEAVRNSALSGLAACPDAVAQLLLLLDTPKADVIGVVNALGAMGPRAVEALPALEKLRTAGGENSLYAAGAIVSIDPSKARAVAPTWITFLDTKNLYNVAVALERLAMDPSLVDLVPVAKVVRLARSKDELVRLHALTVLEHHARTAEAERVATAAIKRCKGATRTCHFGEESACQFVADFDGDGKGDVAVLVTQGTRRSIAVVAKNRCALWPVARPEGGGWTLDGDERGAATRLQITSAEGEVWVVSLRAGKLRGTLQDTQ